jgi:hypothetical protein
MSNHTILFGIAIFTLFFAALWVIRQALKYMDAVEKRERLEWERRRSTLMKRRDAWLLMQAVLSSISKQRELRGDDFSVMQLEKLIEIIGLLRETETER